jgi:hypothetical protein
MAFKSDTLSFNEWAHKLRNGETLRFNVIVFNEFKTWFSDPKREIEEVERDFNIVTFKLKNK